MPTAEAPRWFLAELTYRCVLECAYCSNPLNYRDGTHRDELSGEEWSRVLREARELGCVQLGLSGGEPLLHDDVFEVVNTGHGEGFYVSLITGGTRLDAGTVRRLRREGLDHVQMSLDGAEPGTNDAITNRTSFEEKIGACRRVREAGLPLTLNVVLHRFNMDEIGALIERAADLGADRIELANTQYHGWALANRTRLMPRPEQIERAEATVNDKRSQHDELEIVWVRPDYYQDYPKPCQGGWAQSYLAVTPGGMALPCHSAASIETLEFPSVRDRSLRWIWRESEGFNAFRGTDWMREPCASCPRREVDYGGCRCQAFMLTGDARNADPVCHLSEHRDRVDEAIEQARTTEADPSDLHFRRPQSLRDMPPGGIPGGSGE